jgi:hypothetical protein
MDVIHIPMASSKMPLPFYQLHAQDIKMIFTDLSGRYQDLLRSQNSTVTQDDEQKFLISATGFTRMWARTDVLVREMYSHPYKA